MSLSLSLPLSLCLSLCLSLSLCARSLVFLRRLHPPPLSPSLWVSFVVGPFQPIGIIGSLTIAACIYVAVTLVITGMVDFRTLESSDVRAFRVLCVANAGLRRSSLRCRQAPLSDAFSEVGIHWATYIINVVRS